MEESFFSATSLLLVLSSVVVPGTAPGPLTRPPTAYVYLDAASVVCNADKQFSQHRKTERGEIRAALLAHDAVTIGGDTQRQLYIN